MNYELCITIRMLQKGGVPAAPSGTATLLRLHPPYPPHLRHLPPRKGVGPAASGAIDSGGVTGGVYKARERIHGAVADAPLLANPTSRGRVADPDPNWGRLWGVGSASRLRVPLYRPL